MLESLYTPTHHKNIMIQHILLASSNQGKIREINALFANTSVNIIPQSEQNIDDAEETGLSFVENAIIKARHAARQFDGPVIADDSGISVDALQGAPGVYSARYAGEHGNSEANIAKLLKELRDVPAGKRQAAFHCVIVYLAHAEDPCPVICQGDWPGEILFEARGDRGFGYDPIFFDPKQGCSVAEMSDKLKQTISHRAQALQALIQQLNLQ